MPKMTPRVSRSRCAVTGKRRYATYFEARDAADDIKRSVQEDHGTPYRCEHCDDFHLGRSNA